MNELDIQKEREIFEAVFGVNKVHRKVDYLFKQDMYEAHDYNKKSHQNYAKEVNLRWSGWKRAKRHILKSNNWISVEDRLPENNQIVMCHLYNDNIISAKLVLDEECWRTTYLGDLDVDAYYITHWQPLPNSPVKVEK